MSIIINKKADTTVIPTDVFTKGLSLSAIGLLGYLFSKPYDFKITKKELIKELTESTPHGRDAINRMFNELEEAGYFHKICKRENGRFVYDYEVHFEPLTEKPLSVEPLAENQSSNIININNINNNTNNNNTNNINTNTNINNNNLFAEKIKNFENEVMGFTQYDSGILKNFFNYWSELNSARTKMRWQMQPTFEVSKRLATWYRNSTKNGLDFNKTNRNSKEAQSISQNRVTVL